MSMILVRSAFLCLMSAAVAGAADDGKQVFRFDAFGDETFWTDTLRMHEVIAKAVADLEAKRVATVTHPLYPNALDSLPCIIGSFSAGNYPSAFPVNCLLKGSIGTVPGEDHEGVKRSLVEEVARAAAQDPWMATHPPKVRFVGYDAQASEIPRDHPIVATVCKNYKEITGKDPQISGRQGAVRSRQNRKPPGHWGGEA